GQDFTHPVPYTVTAEDGSTKSYTVTVQTSIPSNAIISFTFDSVPGSTSTVNEDAGEITVDVPYGTNVSSLAPTIVHTGSRVSPESGVPNDFRSSIGALYTLMPFDGGSWKTYTVKVNVARNPAKSITEFRFNDLS